jgi:broad specificity phosphatase PhoE
VPAVAATEIWLVRHGETAWSRTGQHTSRTDVPLADTGREQAAALAPVLAHHRFRLVLTSPRRRANETAALAGLGATAEPCEDLVEWDYGSYEGRTTADIRIEAPGWTLWRDGAPGGETAAAVGERVDRVLARAHASSGEGDVVLVSHGHLLRVLAARWLGLPVSEGRLFALDAGSLGRLGWEREQPVLTTWNTHPTARS